MSNINVASKHYPDHAQIIIQERRGGRIVPLESIIIEPTIRRTREDVASRVQLAEPEAFGIFSNDVQEVHEIEVEDILFMSYCEERFNDWAIPSGRRGPVPGDKQRDSKLRSRIRREENLRRREKAGSDFF